MSGTEADPGFWATVTGLMENEAIRGLAAAGLIALLSIPKALVGEALKRLPAAVLPRTSIPSVLGLVGLLSGVALGYYTPLPMDLSIAVGTGAGLASAAAHDQGAVDRVDAARRRLNQRVRQP